MHTPAIDSAFFSRCALVSVDFQEGSAPALLTDADLPLEWRQRGFTAEDVNAANRFAWNESLPNAVRIVQACRNANLPRIFIHWGYRFMDGMDLDPVIRAMMMHSHGKNYTAWQGHIDQPGSRPPRAFCVQEEEYVLPKTAQDAFDSSNLAFVLANLGVNNVIFIGGHTEACLGKTAASAKRRGYRTLCITDSTTNARESTRIQGILDAQFDCLLTTDALIHQLGPRTE